MVELCLAYGLSPQNILGHVADALHNEAKKRKCFPSEIPKHDKENSDYFFPDAEAKHDRIVELGDCTLMLDYLREIASISWSDVDESVKRKLKVMRGLAESGNAVIIDGLFYRLSARRD